MPAYQNPKILTRGRAASLRAGRREVSPAATLPEAAPAGSREKPDRGH